MLRTANSPCPYTCSTRSRRVAVAVEHGALLRGLGDQERDPRARHGERVRRALDVGPRRPAPSARTCSTSSLASPSPFRSAPPWPASEASAATTLGDSFSAVAARAEVLRRSAGERELHDVIAGVRVTVQRATRARRRAGRGLRPKVGRVAAGDRHLVRGAERRDRAGRGVDRLEHDVVERAVREQQCVDAERIAGIGADHVGVVFAVGVAARAEQVRRRRRERDRAAVGGHAREAGGGCVRRRAVEREAQQLGRPANAGSYLFFEPRAIMGMYEAGRRAARAWLRRGPLLDPKMRPELPAHVETGRHAQPRLVEVDAKTA